MIFLCRDGTEPRVVQSATFRDAHVQTLVAQFSEPTLFDRSATLEVASAKLWICAIAPGNSKGERHALG